MSSNVPTSAYPFVKLAGDDRYTTYPLARPHLFAWYKLATHSMWGVEEVDMSGDRRDYELRLTPQQRHFVEYVLAFFAASDGIVNINIIERFRAEINILEVKYFYEFQAMIENVHAHTYSELLDTIISTQKHRDRLLNAINTLPSIAAMSRFMLDCVNSDAPFAERLFRFACVEGVFFTACFAAIYWLKQSALMPGLCQSNELIARDEAMHTEFACALYNEMEPQFRLSDAAISSICHEVDALVAQFVSEALPNAMAEISAEALRDYAKTRADAVAGLCGHAPVWNATHTLTFMTRINLSHHTNFFERVVTNYSKAVSADTGFCMGDI